MATLNTKPQASRESPADNSELDTYTAFARFRRIASGSLLDVALAVRDFDNKNQYPIFIYSDRTGDLTDVDLRRTDWELVTPSASSDSNSSISSSAKGPRRRGRPTLGVVGREVTLLPRHWDWLQSQPGGTSVALRKLVEQARRANEDEDRKRDGQTRAYRFMSLIGGDLPGFEEASRAFFATDRPRFETLIAEWPPDVVSHIKLLAFSGENQSDDTQP